jgi:nucleoside-diphosphate-sugar epimerase
MISNRLLIVGAGDIASRALPALGRGYEVHAMVRTPPRAQALARLGVRSFVADLDDLAACADALPKAGLLLHAAPPGPEGETDQRTAALLEAMDARGLRPRRVVYVSTSGVYGDCAGERVDEFRPPHPATARARRRTDAEGQLAAWCARRQASLVVLRAPGIYAAERLPRERIQRGTPVLVREHDVYTNHVHADDLAGMCVRALEESAPAGVYNASDDSEMLMGDWMDSVADHLQLPRPPRISRGEAGEQIPAGLLSFMGESRRLINTRLKNVLGYRLLHPTVMQGLKADNSSFRRRATAVARDDEVVPSAGQVSP